ncbi:hypothetical protein [Streptosporangium sp. NPDC006930]|uniref:hypothetical protein n=1 Tax=Streptosporangium sp. NPDC006930 TaxID=3154783 RepID=UPI00343E7BFE
MIDPDSTQAVPAPGRHRVRHWEDNEGYRTRPPSAAGPAAPTPSSPAGPPSGSGHGRPIYREEALRRHARSRAAARMPLVISGPSFLLLWIVVAAILAAGATLITLVLGAGG